MLITASTARRSKKRRRHTSAAADNLIALIGDVLQSTHGREFSSSAAGACMSRSEFI